MTATNSVPEKITEEEAHERLDRMEVIFAELSEALAGLKASIDLVEHKVNERTG